MEYKKLVIQMPAYNEENVIARAINEIPKSIEGIEKLELIVINDGSIDNTAQVAKQAGIRHIIDFDKNFGLGKAFKKGILYALNLGADIIVQTDADLQYKGDQIKMIIKPILEKKADVVIGDRQLQKIKGYPLYKLISQSIGSFLTTLFFGQKIKDVTSGFRAFTSEAADHLIKNLQNGYTSSLESVCILAKKKMRICFVPIDIRYPTRKSKLISSKLYYVKNFFSTLLRCFRTTY